MLFGSAPLLADCLRNDIHDLDVVTRGHTDAYQHEAYRTVTPPGNLLNVHEQWFWTDLEDAAAAGQEGESCRAGPQLPDRRRSGARRPPPRRRFRQQMRLLGSVPSSWPASSKPPSGPRAWRTNTLRKRTGIVTLGP